MRSAASRADWVDKAQRADALGYGYDIFLVADHLGEMPLVRWSATSVMGLPEAA